MRLRTPLLRWFAVVPVCLAALILLGCGGQKSDQPAATQEPASGAVDQPPAAPLTANAVIAFTWFDKDQGGIVSRDWLKARDAMRSLGGYRYSGVFTAMDDQESNVMALSIWDDSTAASRGLNVAQAQLPARGWAKTGVYRRIGADGNMADSLFTSIVMVMPVTSEMDSAHAVSDFIVANGFMRTQPGYMASMLLEHVAGDPTYQHVIASRWGSRDELRQVGGLPAFQALQKQLTIAGRPRTYLQLMY